MERLAFAVRVSGLWATRLQSQVSGQAVVPMHLLLHLFLSTPFLVYPRDRVPPLLLPCSHPGPMTKSWKLWFWFWHCL